MGIIDAFEGALRGFMQGSFKRILPSQVQEQEILDALRKVMDNHVIREQGHQIAPFHYEVRLNEDDYESLKDSSPSVKELQQLRDRVCKQLGWDENLVTIDQLTKLATRVQFELNSIAHSQGYTLTNALRVTFLSEPRFPRGRFEARVASEAAVAPTPPAGASGAPPADATRTIMAPQSAQPDPVVPLPRSAAAAGSMPPAWLTLLKPSRGEPFRLDRPLITIGRGDSNDIVINEKRVSRAHAEIRYDHGIFTIHDLVSQNGVYINGARVSRPAPLKDRDIIYICGYEFIFQRR